jgi:hypothetical protein
MAYPKVCKTFYIGSIPIYASYHERYRIFMNSLDIFKQIELLHFSKKLNYLEATLLWCTINDMEIEEMAHLIKRDPELKLKLQKEGEGVHLLKITLTVANTLPI